MTRRTVLTSLLAVIAALAWASPVALAHEPGTTGIELEFGETGLEGTVDLPLSPLEAALDTTIATDPVGLSSARELVIGYVAGHLEVTGGGSWVESFGRLTAVTAGGVRSLRLEMTLTPPGTTDGIDGAILSYDGLIEHDDSQLVFVTALDVDGGVSLTGVLDADATSIPLGETATTSTSATVWTMAGEGFDHVLDGADHILFLLMLIVPAPLLAVGGRWRAGERRRRESLRRVVHVASAFTVGHSATLVASALGWVSLPTRWVEVTIGVSVAVSALHAMRPLVSHGEVLIAGSFGLVHGLAFAGILDGLDLWSTSLVSLAGFNLGVEAAQVAIIGFTFPALAVLSRHRWYTALRCGAAAIALMAATGWIVERVGLAQSPFGAIEDATVDHLWWIIGVVSVATVAFRLVTSFAPNLTVASARDVSTIGTTTPSGIS